MLKLGLTDDDRALFEATLRATHVRKVEISVSDIDGKNKSELKPILLSGQVSVDMDAEVTRSVTLQLLDPKKALSFDTNSPDEGALFADRMVHIRYGVEVPSLRRTIWVPVFVGPVTKITRAGETVTVECQGKEALSRRAIWKPLTLKKGLKVTAAIRLLMKERGGETLFDVPDLKASMGKARSLARDAEIWATAKSLAASVNRQLFYDGEGRLNLRSYPATGFVFDDGTGGCVLTTPTLTYDLSDLKNTIEVIGTPPKGSKKKSIRGSAVAPAGHILSPWRLGPKGGPRYLVETVTASSITTEKAADAHAKELLERRMKEAVDVSFDSLVIPHLEPGDLVRLSADDLSQNFQLRRFTIPLTGGAMTVGYLKRVVPKARATRKRVKK